MPVAFNHTIVLTGDRAASATFFSEMLGLPAPSEFGPFLAVSLDHNASFDFMQYDGDISTQHYAFLVSEDEFTQIYGRIVERGLEHWADPHQNEPNTINTHDGGRGVYWSDPTGNLLEIITVPYGGWSS